MLPSSWVEYRKSLLCGFPLNNVPATEVVCGDIRWPDCTQSPYYIHIGTFPPLMYFVFVLEVITHQWNAICFLQWERTLVQGVPSSWLEYEGSLTLWFSFEQCTGDGGSLWGYRVTRLYPVAVLYSHRYIFPTDVLIAHSRNAIYYVP